MSTRYLWNPAKRAKELAAVAQGPETASNSAGTPTIHATGPIILGKLKRRIKWPFRSSKHKSTSDQNPTPPIGSNQRQKPARSASRPDSLVVQVKKTSFKGDSDEPTGEIEIYDRGLVAIDILKKLAGLTRPGFPNPVVPIIEALIAVLTQLQPMMKNEGEWKEMLLLIAEHLSTFNGQLGRLKLENIPRDSGSALYTPISRYSTTLRELIAKVLEDAGFDANTSQDNSNRDHLQSLIGQNSHAGEVKAKIEEYRRQLSSAMDFLMRLLVISTDTKEETSSIMALSTDANEEAQNITMLSTDAKEEETSDITVLSTDAKEEATDTTMLSADAKEETIEPTMLSTDAGEDVTDIMVKNSQVELKETHLELTEVPAEIKETVTKVNKPPQKMNDASKSRPKSTGSRAVSKCLPSVSPYSVERLHQMNYMTKHILEAKFVGRRVFVITGMGGSGKTQLVSYFMREMNKGDKLFTHVIFVDASSEVNLKADLQSWDRFSGSGHKQADWNNCLEFLASGPHEGRWALIFANADDPNLKLKRFFPVSSKGTILVTSNNLNIRGLATIGHLRLERMTTDEAIATLELAAGRPIPKDSKEFESAQTLVQDLDCLPLALVHAGTYCRSHFSGDDGMDQPFTFTQYHSLFRKRRAQLKKKGPFTQGDYQHGAYTALDMSYRAVAPLSRRFLHVISNYCYSELPFAMFVTAAKEAFRDPVPSLPRPDEHRNVITQLNGLLCPGKGPAEFPLLELKQDLRSFSLISPNLGSQHLRIHPLVQSWLRGMKLIDGWNYRAMAIQIISSCCFDGYRRIYRHLFPHINEILKAVQVTNLHVNDRLAFGWAFSDCGHYKEAEELLEEGLELLHHVSEGETTEATSLISQMAISYANQSRWDKAEKRQVDLLERQQRILGVDDPKSLAAAADLAITYKNQGQLDKAVKLEEDILERCQRVLGSDHPESLMVASDLALTYWYQGFHDKARKLAVDALENSRRALGVVHPVSLTAATNLAEIYWRQGNWDEAEKLQIYILAKSGILLGQDHPSTIHAGESLALTYFDNRRWRDAEPVLECVVEKYIKLRGERHPDVQRCIGTLSTVYQNLGKLDQARRMTKLLISTSNAGNEADQEAINELRCILSALFLPEESTNKHSTTPCSIEGYEF